jgi:hypothetical protein
MLFVSIPSWAQIPKGTSTIGGSISASYAKRIPDLSDFNSTTTWSLSLRPDYGYFVAKNFCIGASLSVLESRSKTDSYYTPGQHLNDVKRSLEGGPFIRCYLPIDQKLYAFGTARYQWGYTYDYYELEHYLHPDDYSMGSNEYSSKTNTWGVGAGLAYFTSNHLAFELGLDFSRNLTDGSPATNRLALNVGLRFFLFKNEKK